MLDYLHSEGRENQTKTANRFNLLYVNDDNWPVLTQPLISSWRSKEEELRAQHAVDPSAKRARLVEFPDVEAALALWCFQALGAKVPLTGDVIRWTHSGLPP